MAETSTDDTFAALFHAHFSGFLRLATLLGADDPEDVAQEAFARLHRHAARLRDPERALAYLRSTVCNLSRSRLRHLRVVRRHAAVHLPDAASAEHDAGVRADRAAVLAALDRLPARQREALVLRYWLDLSGNEIASAMGISVGAVKSHLARGISALAASMGDEA